MHPQKPAFGHGWAGLKEGVSIDTHGGGFWVRFPMDV